MRREPAPYRSSSSFEANMHIFPIFPKTPLMCSTSRYSDKLTSVFLVTRSKWETALRRCGRPRRNAVWPSICANTGSGAIIRHPKQRTCHGRDDRTASPRVAFR